MHGSHPFDAATWSTRSTAHTTRDSGSAAHAVLEERRVAKEAAVAAAVETGGAVVEATLGTGGKILAALEV